MPEEDIISQSAPARSAAPESGVNMSPRTTETLQMLMASLGNQPNLPITEVHVSEMLAQRRQINEFISDDKKRGSWDQKYYLTIGLVFILIISGLVIFTHPEYFTQVLSLIIGGFGGFGLGRASKHD